VRVALLEQSNRSMQATLQEILATLKKLCTEAAQEAGARRMKERFINCGITFATLFAAFELHKFIFK
jgi:hypothetical protein